MNKKLRNIFDIIFEKHCGLIFNIAPTLPPVGSGQVSGVSKINLLPEFILTKEGGRGKQIDFQESLSFPVIQLKQFFIIPVFFCFLQLHAQPLEMNSRKPDFKAIEKEISDKNSPYFYEKLFKRYDSGDTTLTPVDYWYLYYGYSFEPEYMPYQTIEEMDDFSKITKKKELEEKDFKRIISISEKEMKKLPFELDLMWYEYVSWNGLGDSAKAKVAYLQFMGVIDAIIASGNGMDCETGFSVLYVSHEYVLLNILGFEFGGKQSLTDGLCDKLDVSGNEYGIEALFFDVNRIFAVNLDKINK